MSFNGEIRSQWLTLTLENTVLYEGENFLQVVQCQNFNVFIAINNVHFKIFIALNLSWCHDWNQFIKSWIDLKMKKLTITTNVLLNWSSLFPPQDVLFSTTWRNRSPTLLHPTSLRLHPSCSSSCLTFPCLLVPSLSCVSILELIW